MKTTPLEEVPAPADLAPASGPPVQEWAILLVLAAVQFTNIMDFMIIMPLGPQFIRVFHITPAQFGLLVSCYTISAGTAGILASFVIDRFDRKTALLLLYAGFTTGTFLCALAPTYELLLAARVLTGAFGGVLGAMVYAVIGDAFPEWRRGTATGIVTSAFGFATVAGVPFGLYLGTEFGWEASFLLLAGLGAVILAGAAGAMPRMRGHLTRARLVRALAEMRSILSNPNHQSAFALVVAMMVSSFIVFPYLSPALVNNVGLLEKHLPWIYIVSGALALVASPIVGRLADRYGKLRVYRIAVVLSVGPIVAITNLGPVPLGVVLVLVSLLVLCNSSRMVAAMAMVTSSVVPQQRGGFMSVNAAVQNYAAGLATYAGGLIIGQAANKSLTNYGLAGGLAVAAAVLSVFLAGRLRVEDATGVPAEAEG
jgi:predicted MFS family arabinose efflux permease